MKRDTSARRSDDSRQAASRKPWHRPQLTTISVEEAQAMVTFASDGLYAVS